MISILTKSAKVGSVTARTTISQPRGERFLLFPGKSKCWTNPFVGDRHDFSVDCTQLFAARAAFHFYATWIIPSIVAEIIGKDSKYALAYLGTDGNSFHGNKTYKVNVPKNLLMKDF